MKFLLAFILMTKVSLASNIQFPQDLLNHKNLGPIVFQNLKTYMFQLNQDARVQNTDAGCRVYRFFHHEWRKFYILRSCITRTRSEGELTEKVLFTSQHKNQVHFTFRRKGENLRETSDGDLFSLNFPIPGEESFYSLSSPQMKFKIRSKLNRSRRITSIHYDFEKFVFSIKEQRHREDPYQLYTCNTCGKPFRAMIKWKDAYQSFQYFVDNFIEDVTPLFFNQYVGEIASEISQGSQGIIMSLMFQYEWPPVGDTGGVIVVDGDKE